MQRRQKENSLSLYNLTYQQTTKYQPFPYLNQLFLLLQYALFLSQFYQIINPGIIQSNFPFFTSFIGCASAVAAFLLLTLVSYYFQILATVWMYLLLLLEAAEIVYIEITIQCFTGSQWCNSDAKIQISCIAVFLLFVLTIVLRSYCYCPLYETSNPLSMKTGRAVIYTFIYATLISVSSNHVLAASDSATKQLCFLITIIFVALTKEPASCNPNISRTLFIMGATILWTSGLVWIMPLIEQLIGTSSGSIWYYWGFSMPVVLGLTYLHSAKFRKGYEWQALFFEDQSQTLEEMFLRVNQTIKVVDIIKKSELKTNCSQFRILWGLIQNHNEKCANLECPLLFIKSMRISREDQLIEQKRFSKTLEKTLEFCLQQLSNQHDRFPNLIELRLEIANFQLEVFHLRTKGLQLYNREFGKGNSSEKDWGIYYLKQKIEGFEGSGQTGMGEKEQEIAAFKHGIEVSVTMLAEFWYFLSDPKCNIKKLYDLTNVLFPLKIGVDEAWQTVKQLKNIESYHLYARYLIRMFNDKEKGLKILEEARKIEAAAHEKQEVLAGSEGHSSEENGVIFLQFDGKKSGIMYQVNTACEKMFNYNKGELLGRKVNQIMPRLFSKYHDRILENYQQTSRTKMMNKDRSVWGRAKDGYLFPFTICIKPVRNYFSQTGQVYASLKKDLWLKEKAFFFTDCDYHLTDLSASMLALFPQTAGRIHLKKKLHISELVPEYETVMPRLVQQKETHELHINRTFSVSSTETYTQKITFSMQAEEVIVGVAGSIGYYVRLFKGSSQNSQLQENQKEELQPKDNVSTVNDSRLEKFRQLRKNFQFIGTTGDQGQRMVFQGGVAKDSAMFRTMMLSRISNNLEQERQANRKENDGEERLDFARDIKTKRLQGNIIREIHELSEDSELNGAAGPDNQEDESSSSDVVKPSELNSILDRETGNKPIFMLKFMTVVLLGLSTLLSILEYVSLYSNKVSVNDTLATYTSLNSLHAQVMFLNLFSTRFSMNSTSTSDLTAFAADVNLLDHLTSSLPLSVQAKLVYSDGSSQNMLLAFAINKLISEAQVITSGITTQAQLFFTQYNSVNGLDVGCQEAEVILGQQITQSVGKSLNQCIIYLIVSCCVFSLIFLIKNIILRKVLLKKAQILNIFFQIPRYSCSSIQKQCERFIQRLSADNDDEFDLEALQGQEEEAGDPASKRHSQQKKRTIMGEEKTSTNFVIVSLLMLLLLLVYPMISLLLEEASQQSSKFAVETMLKIASIEKEVIKTMSYLNTHITQPSYPLAMQSPPLTQISLQQNYIFALLSTITANFFTVGGLMDDQYLKSYNALFFDNLCTGSTTCQITLGEDKGLNNILYNYYDYMVGKYQSVTAANGTYNLTTLYSSPQQTQQDSYRVLMKKYWRQMEEIGISGTKRLLLGMDSLLFGVMLCVCVLNCTVLLWAWMSFYGSLQKKIMATEYILTFIPIDEINKNCKIVKYIKEQVLRMH